MVLKKITLNNEYFNEKDNLIKGIPKGETILFVEFDQLNKNIKNDNPHFVETTNANIVIEMVSESNINYRGKILDFISSIFQYFENLYINTLNI